jgi:spermidine synthase
MSARFEEIDWCPTSMGDISLRRRRDAALGKDVYEIKLDDDFLMSSMFTEGEIALARLALAAAPDPGAPLDVAVGGLGLGYTARGVLDDPRVRSLVVVEALAEVIDWHERDLLPLSSRLTSDVRCRLVHGDFFSLISSAREPGPADETRRFHAIIVDIDHSPRHLLSPTHAAFYRAAGLGRLADRLHPGGVFALWSNDPPDPHFAAELAEVFPEPKTHVVDFDNPLQGRKAANTVYIATAPNR